MNLTLRKNDTATGFTLIEVLIAVAITAVIIAALYSTFFLSRRAVDAVDDSLIRLQETRAVLDIMKREIESAVCDKTRPYTLFKLDDRDFYGKQASQLVMTTFAPLLPGVSKITYAVEEKDGRLTLTKKIDAAYGKPVETRSIALVEDIDSFTVEAGFGDKWVKTWDGTASNLPDEVRISVMIRAKKDENPVTISDVAKLRVGRAL
jgi:prepilin-type N-terminal cleavage/methylation domain-containing protein